MRSVVVLVVLVCVAPSCKRPDPNAPDRAKPVEAGGLAPSLPGAEAVKAGGDVAPPATKADMVQKVIVRGWDPGVTQTQGQVSDVKVRGYDPAEKKEIVGKPSSPSAADADVATPPANTATAPQ